MRAVVDDGRLLEIHERFAQSIVVGFARIGGAPIGAVANQPQVLAGCLDIKAARFVGFCGCFNVPLVKLVDVLGFLPGLDQDYGGLIAHRAKLLYAFAEATVPKVTVITRKAYGGAYDVMASKHIRADYNLAFPTAEIAVMSPEGAVSIVYRSEIQQAADPAAARARFADDYKAKFASPYKTAELGFIDEVIYPRMLRTRLCSGPRPPARQAGQEPTEEARKHPALAEFCGSWEPARAVLRERSASKPLRAPRQVGAGASDAVARPIPSV